MSTLKVLFLSRSTLTTVPAGDTVQVLNTKKALERLGVSVKLELQPNRWSKSYDLIHIFNTIPIQDIYPAYLWAKDSGLPIVVSPIYWDAAGWVQEIAAEPGELKRLAWWEATQYQRREVFTGAELLLPNAYLEAEQIQKDFPGLQVKYQVVPNATEPAFASGSAARFRRRYKIYGDFIFCSARVDPRKNQLALIQALAGTSFQLVFAGTPGDAAYFRRFKASLGEKNHYLGPLKPSDLADAYAAARVHALVSWYDTPGLANLEAGLAGCRLVTTNRGTAQEYLGSEAFYCDPNNLESIGTAVVQAYGSSVPKGLRTKIAQEYTWGRVGDLTLTAYHQILND